MSCQRLPPETCDRIIDHLHAEPERRTLNACALVCRAWLPAARLHRFRRISLSRFNFKWESVLKLLCDPRSTVTVLPYVRELVLEEGNGPPARLDRTVLSQIPYQRMHALESVTIRDLGWYRREAPPYVCTLSAETLQCLKDICRGVKHLSLVSPHTDSILPVLDLISGIDALDRLSMVTIVKYEDFHPRMVSALHCSNLASLRHLELDWDSYVLMDGLKATCPDLSLRSFAMRGMRSDGVEAFGRFLVHVGKTLEHLELSIDDWDSDLTSLTANVGRTLARGLGCCRSLATISLGIHTEVYQEVRSALAASSLPLDEIQRLFSSRGPLSAVKLVVVGHGRDIAVLVEMRRMLFEPLHALREEGRLEFMRGDGKSMDPYKQTSLEEDMDKFFSY